MVDNRRYKFSFNFGYYVLAPLVVLLVLLLLLWGIKVAVVGLMS